MTKLKMWNPKSPWDESEKEWDRGKEEAKQQQKLKGLKSLPQMPGITPDTARHLKWKSLWYMITHDKDFHILRNFFKHPLKYSWQLLQSALKKKPFHREGDFFYYGVKNFENFEKLIQQEDNLFVIGFSYCHKPFECPSGRFNDQCIRDPDHPVCRQCFIGKCLNALPEKRSIPLIIPTIHYIGKEIFEVVHKHPGKEVLFMITACEMTLEMFGDWGNMVAIKGIGVRLDGRICNTMRAFDLSEKGIKPGLTVVLEETQNKMLSLIRKRWVVQHKLT